MSTQTTKPFASTPSTPSTPPAFTAISRRRFLQTTAVAGLAAAASAWAPRVHARDKSGLKNPILGSGEHTYECIHDWLTPPAGLLWGDTHGLAQDEAGRIYVAHTVHPTSTKAEAVVVYGDDGKFLSAWGAEFRNGAHGLDIRKEKDGEFLYHCDINRRLVEKTDLKGESLWRVGYPKESGVYKNREGYKPTNIALHPEGDIYVGDGYGSSYIHRLTADGAYVKTIARPGKDKGLVNCPHGLWVDARSGTPRLAVADRGNRRIQYMTLEGEHLGFVTDGMRQPCHFKVRGDELLVPDLDHVVTILDKDNRVIVHLGDGATKDLRDAPREAFVPGQFIHPHSAIWLKNGDILVAEWVPIGRITLLKKVSA